MAGLLPSANLTQRGFMPSGLYMQPTTKYIDSGASINIGEVEGFLLVRDSYSWAGYNLFWCTGNKVQFIIGNTNDRAFSVSRDSENGGYKITNGSDRRRAYGLIYQKIPIPG